jgi:hypothetical protein
MFSKPFSIPRQGGGENAIPAAFEMLLSAGRGRSFAASKLQNRDIAYCLGLPRPAYLRVHFPWTSKSLRSTAMKIMNGALLAACLLLRPQILQAADDWSASVKFPETEKPVRLFNGKDLTGWHGNTGAGGTPEYFKVVDGVIVARNEKDNAPKVSNYLLTDKKYRNFRLVFEGKLAESSMHSGIALWGKQYEKDGEKNSYQGHLVMFPSGWGFYDLFRRNSIYKDDGRAKKADNKDWNKMEILAIGNRIRLAVNGMEVADWKDDKPELCEEGPIGLQLHSNPNVAQEVRFRGLILAENPEDKLITVK